VLAEGDGGPTCVLFTAMHPERVTGLILAKTTARRFDGVDANTEPGDRVSNTMAWAYRAGRQTG
jgi:hypothetical protein